ncbi:RNA polymerase sigma factor [Brevibacillus massiliensis]|uniref:RNA polymerase sigma factor n=1 Tax=Brevibacillus massiliensis TaxID=1118054 RepID=UPI0003184D99|nr:sigma-70 family RNA polymerase sigma factor [Brevibacillus massiliensis]
MDDDKDLVRRVLTGDTQAYSQIIARYKQKIFALMYRMSGHPQDAQDLAQEVFIKAFYRLPQYSGEKKFSAWLYRIATNHCIDELRKKKQSATVPLDSVNARTETTPESIYLKKEQRDRLEEHIEKLPENYRIIFLLRHTQQLSYQEIAEILDISTNTVQVRLFRARQKLRERMATEVKGGSACEVYDF